jgi:hypothetical protein
LEEMNEWKGLGAGVDRWLNKKGKDIPKENKEREYTTGKDSQCE